MLRPTLQMLAAAAAAAAAPAPPRLPEMWVADDTQPGAPGDGAGREAYMFVAKPHPDTPSALWSNYTKAGCRRLIRDVGYDTTRYLLGCDAVNCCTEEGDGNQVEFQIPNCHSRIPGICGAVSYAGKEVVTPYGEAVTADAWQWSMKIPLAPKGCAASYTAFTTPNATDNSTTLHQWRVQVPCGGEPDVNITFRHFRAVPESERTAFQATFAVPEVCQGNVLSCGDAEKRGLLSAATRRAVSTADPLARVAAH